MHDTKLARRMAKYDGDFDLSSEYHLSCCGGGGGEASAEERELYGAQADTALAQLENYKKYMPSALSNFATASNRYFDPSYRQGIRARAGADAEQAIGTSMSSMIRNAGRYGINPNSGRFLGVMGNNAIANAGLRTNALNKAGQYVDDMQLAASKDFSNSLMGLSSNAAQSLGSAASGFANLNAQGQQQQQANWQGAGMLAGMGMDAWKMGMLPFADGGSVEDKVREHAISLGVDPDLALRVAMKESGLRSNATSRKGAAGIMQLMPGTAKAMGVRDPRDADQNIRGGLRYLKMQLDANKGDVGMALAAYNWGPGNLRKRGLENAPRETRNYIRTIAPDYEMPPMKMSTKRSQKTAPTPVGAMSYDTAMPPIGLTYTPDTSSFTKSDASYAPSPMLPSAAAQTAPYVVQKGDNLWKIAQANGMDVDRLLELNPQYRKNPNVIQPGQSVNLGYAGGGLVGNAGLVNMQNTPHSQRATEPSPLGQLATAGRVVMKAKKELPGAINSAAGLSHGLSGSTMEALGSAGLEAGSEQALALAAQEAGITGGLESIAGAALPWLGIAAGVASLFMADGGEVSSLEQYFQRKGWNVNTQGKKMLFETLFGRPYRGTPEEDSAMLQAFVADDAEQADAAQWDRLPRTDADKSVRMASGGMLNTKTSVVDAFKAAGLDSAFAKRKAVYERMYGEPYSGTAEQNMQVLKDMQRVLLNQENPANVKQGSTKYAKPKPLSEYPLKLPLAPPPAAPVAAPVTRQIGSPELEAAFRNPAEQAVEPVYPVETAVGGLGYGKGLASLVSTGVDTTRKLNALTASAREAAKDASPAMSSYLSSTIRSARPGYADGGDFRAGGDVDGPGTETSDSIPARLSDGEFVVNAEAVKIPGVKELLEQINNAGLQRRYGAASYA